MGLLTTIACNAKGEPEYALEGSVFIAGASIQWLRDELKIVHDSFDSEYFAQKVTIVMVYMLFQLSRV